jgi:hypothetical protein
MLINHVKYYLIRQENMSNKMKTNGLRLVVLLIMNAGLGGCGGTAFYQQVSSGYIDCKADDINISNQRAELNSTEVWTAECNGKKYRCSYDSSDNTDCNEISENR